MDVVYPYLGFQESEKTFLGSGLIRNEFLYTLNLPYNNISTGKNITQHALILIQMHRFNGNDIVIGTCSRLIEVFADIFI